MQTTKFYDAREEEKRLIEVGQIYEACQAAMIDPSVKSVAFEKISRAEWRRAGNAPCTCGSGKKAKNCHGPGVNVDA